jgi:DNA-binding GntR family transcriptional regulator
MDPALLNALKHPEAFGILEVLLKGEATLKEIAAELSMTPVQLNYRMRKLEAVGLVQRKRSHGPWELGVSDEPIRQILVFLYEIELDIAERALEQQRTRVRALRENTE